MNHYDTLEISPRASPEVIRAAYRSLMQRFHPDRNPGDPAAAARASGVASAYEVLSDAERRASYDASLQAAAQPEMRAPRQPGRPAPASAPVPRIGLWSVVVVVVVVGALAVAGGIWLSRSLTAGITPVAELASIRKTIASNETAEAERRRLYARKLAILAQHPELLRGATAERSEDMAARTFSLLASPLVVQVGDSTAGAGPARELTISAATLLVGTFDAPNLLAHMARHRERLVQDVAAQLAKEDPERLARPEGERHVKRILQEAVTASLGIGAPAEYPSTYFESPGRYGVVDVLLTGRLGSVPLGSSR